jgi:lysophospholipase L1-like esterase
MLVLSAALAALTACSGSALSDSPPTRSPESGVLLVAIGDSIPFNSEADCPGCTGFVDDAAAELEDSSGRTVTVRNLSRHDGARTQDIADQLETDRAAINALSEAQVVIASFGFNDQPPYFGAPAPCPTIQETDDDATVFAAMTQTSTDCIDDQHMALSRTARTVLTRLRELAPDASIGVLNSYNAWIGWGLLETDYPDLRDGITAITTAALDRWDETVCAEAELIEATCVDVYHRVNGEDGRTPAGSLLAPDYTHPSQEGNDVIAEEIASSGLLSGTTP